MNLHYEVHPRNGRYPVDLYIDAAQDGSFREQREAYVTDGRSKKHAEEICAALNRALALGAEQKAVLNESS